MVSTRTLCYDSKQQTTTVSSSRWLLEESTVILMLHDGRFYFLPPHIKKTQPKRPICPGKSFRSRCLYLEICGNGGGSHNGDDEASAI